MKGDMRNVVDPYPRNFLFHEEY